MENEIRQYVSMHWISSAKTFFTLLAAIQTTLRVLSSFDNYLDISQAPLMITQDNLLPLVSFPNTSVILTLLPSTLEGMNSCENHGEK